MRKNLVKGMAALAICAAFASCSHDTDFESANQELVVENLKNEYKANFVKKYGEIDPDQSWDFTNFGNATRGEASTQQQFVGPNFYSYCLIDYKAIKELTDGSINAQTSSSSNSYEYKLYGVNYTVTAEAKNITFERYFTAVLTPSFIRIDGSSSYSKRYYHLFFQTKEMIPNTNGTCHSSEYWYGKLSPNNGLITDRSSIINTSSSQGGEWYAYYTDNTGNGTAHHNTTPVTKVREFKVTATTKKGEKFERTYWGFDCDGADNGKVDLICLVEDYKTPYPIEKRYMIEDLGTTDDTDFNDIVVDFKDDQQGHQTAIIRAMGGTLDFTLKVAGTAVWTKSVNGPTLTPAINVKDMVNTGLDDILYSKELDNISISGWDPSTNNISITVKYSVDDSKTGTSIYYEYDIPFPEVGQVPMMFATNINVPWMVEREDFPKWWLEVYSKQTEEE